MHVKSVCCKHNKIHYAVCNPFSSISSNTGWALEFSSASLAFICVNRCLTQASSSLRRPFSIWLNSFKVRVTVRMVSSRISTCLTQVALEIVLFFCVQTNATCDQHLLIWLTHPQFCRLWKDNLLWIIAEWYEKLFSFKTTGLQKPNLATSVYSVNKTTCVKIVIRENGW